jgi:hypothetical protein
MRDLIHNPFIMYYKEGPRGQSNINLNGKVQGPGGIFPKHFQNKHQNSPNISKTGPKHFPNRAQEGKFPKHFPSRHPDSLNIPKAGPKITQTFPKQAPSISQTGPRRQSNTNLNDKVQGPGDYQTQI